MCLIFLENPSFGDCFFCRCKKFYPTQTLFFAPFCFLKNPLPRIPFHKEAFKKMMRSNITQLYNFLEYLHSYRLNLGSLSTLKISSFFSKYSPLNILKYPAIPIIAPLSPLKSLSGYT